MTRQQWGIPDRRARPGAGAGLHLPHRRGLLDGPPFPYRRCKVVHQALPQNPPVRRKSSAVWCEQRPLCAGLHRGRLHGDNPADASSGPARWHRDHMSGIAEAAVASLRKDLSSNTAVVLHATW